jgi:sulfur carrier protein
LPANSIELVQSSESGCQAVRRHPVTAQAGLALKIIVNGDAATTGAATLAELVDELGFKDARVATAVNGDFVAERARTAARLSAGDRIEIVSPRQGG